MLLLKVYILYIYIYLNVKVVLNDFGKTELTGVGEWEGGSRQIVSKYMDMKYLGYGSVVWFPGRWPCS